MLLITGPAGHGKTALMAGLARHGREQGLTVHAMHHCLERLPTSTDPVRVFASIAGQLARSVPGYAAVVGNLGLSERGGQTDPSAAARAAVLDSPTPNVAYTRALSDPLGVLASTGRLTGDVVLAVDGLDECTSERSSILAHLLAGQLDDVAVPQLRVIATARPTLLTGTTVSAAPAPDGVLAQLGGTSSFDLASDCPDIARDVNEFLSATHLTRRDMSVLENSAGGCLLYADLATRLDRAGVIAVRRCGELPGGLPGLYGAVLGNAKPFARTVLSVLARSRGDGLSPRQLARLLDADRSDVHDVLSQFALVIEGHGRRRAHHRCLGDYLSTAIDVPAATDLDWLIAERLLRDGVGRWRSTDGYGRRNVLIHLAEVAAGPVSPERKRDAITAIATTANEPSYLTTALGSVGVDDLVSALGYVLDRAPTLAPDVARTVDALQAQASILRTAWASRDHNLITQQLVYEAATIGATNLGRSLVDRIGGAGILTLWATANSPARFAPDSRPGHLHGVDDATIMRDGERGVTSSRDGVFRVWQLASGQLDYEIDTAGGLHHLHALTDAAHVLIAGQDGLSEVVNIESGARFPLVPGRTAEESAFAVDRDGTRGIVGDADGNATIWDLEIGAPMLRLSCRADLVTAVDITADGWLAATGSHTGDIMLWDVPTGLAVHRFTCPGVVSALSVAPCGKRIIVGDHNSVSVYTVPDVAMPVPAARLVTRSRVTALAVNPAMPNYVLCGTASGQVMYLRLP